MYNLCLINTGGLRQAETWDLGPSAVILVPGQTSPIATNYKFCVCVLTWGFCNPMDGGSPPGSSVHGISQARVPEWVAISLFKGSSVPRDQTWVSCIAGGFFTTSSAQLENILDNKIQKKKKAQNSTATSEELGAKPGSREQNRVLRMSLTLKTTKGWADQ